MDFFDLINELRKGKPDIKKAEKAMKVLGWICVVGAVWNFAIYFIAPFKESPFKLPAQYPYLALTSLLFLGTLFFRAARGIKEMESWGKKTGQVAIVLLIVVFFGFMFYVFPSNAIPMHDSTFSIIFIIFIAIAFAQFAVPAFLGVRYLGRLPVQDDNYDARRYRSDNLAQTHTINNQREVSASNKQYKDSPFPFGIIGTFAIMMAVFMVAILFVEKLGGPELIPYVFLPAFFIMFFGPVIYNTFPSSFQKERSIVRSFTGGGSISLFHGSWPFFKLMVYHDGLEIRAMFHRYFIPYDKMDNIPDKVGFFNRGLLIKSDLPDVPSGIRFSGFGMKKIVEVVNETRNNYLAKSS